MPKVTNNSMVNQEIVVSKKSEERRTESLKPGETKTMSINMKDMHMKAAVFAGAIFVSGEDATETIPESIPTPEATTTINTTPSRGGGRR